MSLSYANTFPTIRGNLWAKGEDKLDKIWQRSGDGPNLVPNGCRHNTRVSKVRGSTSLQKGGEGRGIF